MEAKLAAMKWTTVFGIAVALAAGYYYFIFDSGAALDAQVESARGQMAEREALLRKTQAAVRDAKKFEEDLKAITEEFEGLVSYMPTESTVNETMSDVSREANAAGIMVEKIETTRRIEKVEFYETNRIDLKMKGTFSQLVHLLARMSRLPRLLTLDKIDIRVRSTDENGIAQLGVDTTLVTYRYIGDSKNSKDGKNASAK